MIENEVVRVLKDYVEFIPICPEMEVGLSTPRDPFQVVVSRKKKSFIQIKEKRDFTSLIKVFAVKFFQTRKDLDGFILKSKSPSCGAYSTKLYKSAESNEPVAIGSGLFAEVVQKIFPLLPVIEESDLFNLDIRNFFLTKIFILAAFRVVEQDQSMEKLRRFLEKNATLLNWFNPAMFNPMKALMDKVSNCDRVSLFTNFRNSLLMLLAHRPSGEMPVNDAYPEVLRSFFRTL